MGASLHRGDGSIEISADFGLLRTLMIQGLVADNNQTGNKYTKGKDEQVFHL